MQNHLNEQHCVTTSNNKTVHIRVDLVPASCQLSDCFHIPFQSSPSVSFTARLINWSIAQSNYAALYSLSVNSIGTLTRSLTNTLSDYWFFFFFHRQHFSNAVLPVINHVNARILREY